MYYEHRRDEMSVLNAILDDYILTAFIFNHAIYILNFKTSHVVRPKRLNEMKYLWRSEKRHFFSHAAKIWPDERAANLHECLWT